MIHFLSLQEKNKEIQDFNFTIPFNRAYKD
jgi:hypothetical protein